MSELNSLYQTLARGMVFFYTKALNISSTIPNVEDIPPEYNIEKLKNLPHVVSFLTTGSVKVMGMNGGLLLTSVERGNNGNAVDKFWRFEPPAQDDKDMSDLMQAVAIFNPKLLNFLTLVVKQYYLGVMTTDLTTQMDWIITYGAKCHIFHLSNVELRGYRNTSWCTNLGASTFSDMKDVDLDDIMVRIKMSEHKIESAKVEGLDAEFLAGKYTGRYALNNLDYTTAVAKLTQSYSTVTQSRTHS